MTLQPSYRSVVVMCAFSALCFFGAWRAWRHLFAIDAYAAVLDPRFSAASQAAINTVIAENKSLISYPSLFVALLKERCPAIQSVSVRYAGPYNALIQIAAQKPFLHINACQVYTHNASLVDAHLYDAHMNAAAYQLAIRGDVASVVAQPYFSSWISHIAQNFWHEYALCWVDQYTVRLQSIAYPELTIMCSAQIVPTQKLVDLCFQVVEREREDNKKNKVKNRGVGYVIADIRFAHQIVFSHDTARGMYGAS